MLFRPADVALAWAGVYDGAIAAALCPDATVESVVQAALAILDAFRSQTHKSWSADGIRREIERGLDIAARSEGFEQVRAAFNQHYDGSGTPYAMSTAAETVTKALAMFVLAGGDARAAILYGVNLGRDTDCIAAMAGGLAGALTGIGAVPEEWVSQVDEATFANPYTNIQVTIEDHARGLYEALQSRLRRMRALAGELEEPYENV
jgi:ADP-ribosylglycohydrolase